MFVNFSTKEFRAIESLAKKHELTPSQIIVLALRQYQLVDEEYYFLTKNYLQQPKEYFDDIPRT